MLNRKTIVFLIFSVLPSIAMAGNLLDDPNFEDPNTLNNYWDEFYYPSNCGSIDVNSEGYEDSNCLRMQLVSSPAYRFYAYQELGVNTVTPGVYELYAKFKTPYTRNGRTWLVDSNWDGDGNDLTWRASAGGTGEWNTVKKIINIPEEGGDGNPIENHNLAVWLYGYYNNDPYDTNAIYWDDVVFQKVEIPNAYSDIEEREDWSGEFKYFSDDNSRKNCESYYVTYCDANSDPNITGQKALVLQGSKTTDLYYNMILPLKPDTIYKVSTRLKVKDRKTYNYLDLEPNYPSYHRSSDCPCRGVWSGDYYINIIPNGWADEVCLTQKTSLGYVRDENKEWFYEESYLRTPKSSEQSVSTKIIVHLEGFDGKLYLDNFNIEEVNSVMSDAALRIPIDYEFEGMKIINVNQTTPSITTNAAEFVFDNSTIVLKKGTNTVGKIEFPSNFLSGLNINQDVNGLVILNNNNITLSIGSDSSMLLRLENDAIFAISGNDSMNPNFYNFETGIIFVSDYEKGILFSPIYPALNLELMEKSVGVHYDSNIVDFSYNDNELDPNAIVVNWMVDSNFANANWTVRYDCNEGDAFIASVFPPKDFNDVKYATERASYAYDISLNKYPDANYSYYVQKFKERFNYLLLWQGTYNRSSPDIDAPSVCYRDCNLGVYVGPSHANDPDVIIEDVIHNDIAGPFIAKEPNALNRLVELAHEQDVKVIIYMAPFQYYTSDPNTLLDNLENIISTYGIDGVYFDGLSGRHRTLKDIELVRKTRNLLRNKFYFQHASDAAPLIYDSDHFRNPFLDAFADRIYLGEKMKKDLTGDPNHWVLQCAPDANAWGLLYCNKNLSNTPSRLKAELRPIDWSVDEPDDPNYVTNTTLSPLDQIDYQLKYKGTFWIWLFGEEYSSYIEDSKYNEKIWFDIRDWWEPYNALCIQYTSGNGVADIGENIYNAREDCAPLSDYGILVKSGNTYECTTDYSVAQWLIDSNEPFYRLHFTFDSDIVTDDSDNKMNPNHLMAVKNNVKSGLYESASDSNYTPPISTVQDGRNVFYFNGASKIFGVHDDTLCFTDANDNAISFSSFAIIKRTDATDPNEQIIFALNSNNHFYYGIDSNKLKVSVNGNPQTCDSGSHIIGAGWHTIGLVYANDSNTLSLYIDAVEVNSINVELNEFPEFGTYTIGGLSKTDNTKNFDGYIDDLFVTDKALSSTQISQYHQYIHRTLTISSNEVYCILTKDGKKYTALHDGIWNITRDCNYASIQTALSDANDGDEIVVFPGTYHENIDFGGVACTLRSADPNNCNIVETTILDSQRNANNPGRVVTFDSGEDANSVLMGFTITGGYATGTYPADRGGGIYCYNATPVISKCKIIGNYASQGGGIHCRDASPNISDCNIISNNGGSGGGVYLRNALPQINDCDIKSNNATSYAGGIYCYTDVGATIDNCNITNNNSDAYAGGIYCYNSSPEIIKCNILDNNSTNYGGGIYLVGASASPLISYCVIASNTSYDGGGLRIEGGAPTIENCILYGNSSGNRGAGIYNKSGALNLINCTVAKNVATGYGGGMFNYLSCTPTLINCILWNNEGSGSSDEILNYSGIPNPNISYCDIAGCGGSGNWNSSFGTDGGGNVDTSPLFVDANANNFHLNVNSPCIDVGDPNGDYSGQKDIDGEDRVIDISGKGDDVNDVDMGADEYNDD